MSEYYSPGQLSVIYPYLPREPRWLLLGGPADANEAQTAVARWPDIRVVGVEMNPDAIAWQLAHGWPPGQVLLHAALWDQVGLAPVANAGSTLRHASLYGSSADVPDDPRTIQTTTWDTLDKVLGPFEDAVVWMDIEGSELAALRGATNLIASGRVLLWNIEMLSHIPGLMESVPALLRGYRAVKDWNASDACRDRIFVREDLLSV